MELNLVTKIQSQKVSLGHTNASLMLQYNVPAKVASQRLGHSSIGITLDLYSHVIGDLQTEAAQKLDTGIFQKLG